MSGIPRPRGYAHQGGHGCGNCAYVYRESVQDDRDCLYCQLYMPPSGRPSVALSRYVDETDICDEYKKDTR